MSAFLQSGLPQRIEYTDSETCWVCGAIIDSNKKRFGCPVTYPEGRGLSRREVVCFSAICTNCFQQEQAVLEAEIENRRFTEICVAQKETHLAGYFGSRCPCGRVALMMKNFCPSCSKERRMLDKEYSATLQIRRLIKEFNNWKKDEIKNQDNR